MLTIGSLFSGIGGLEIGLERAGLGPVVYQVESDPFCRAVLERHWPDTPRYEDVRTLPTLPSADLVCGGFPCQDVSSAGKGAGLAGQRSGLWSHFRLVVARERPRWVVVENVASGAARWVDQVQAQLAGIGYASLSLPLSAKDVGAPHLRRRIFVVAHALGQPVREQSWWSSGEGWKGEALAGLAGEDGDASDSDQERRSWRARPWPEYAGWKKFEDGYWRPPVSPVCRVDDGVPARLDRLRALGNAVVPQCAEVVGWVVRELEGQTP